MTAVAPTSTITYRTSASSTASAPPAGSAADGRTGHRDQPDLPERSNPAVVAIAAIAGVVVFVLVRVGVEQFTGLGGWWSAGLAMPLCLAALLATGTALDALVKSSRSPR